jgi:hypothetical protein
MGLFVFGAGSVLYRVLDSTGTYQASRLPTLKEATVKIDGKIETQRGSNVYPEDAASGERKISGTLKWGKLAIAQLNAIIFSGTATVGSTVKVVIDEGGTAGVPPVTNAYTAALGTPGPWVDMGVVSAVDGFPLTRIPAAGTLAGGQYKFVESTGTWTFFASDPRAVKVRPSYRYTDATTGQIIELGNPLEGTLADIELVLWKPRFTKSGGLILYHAVLSGIDMASKQGTYTDPTATFEAFVDQAKGSPGQWFGSDPD